MNTPKIRFKGFDGSGKMICLHVGQYLIASGASALTSTPKATMRKNVNCFRLFYGNVRSAYRAAIIYSLISTCKAADVDPRTWMDDVLRKIPYCQRDQLDLAELLPFNWKNINE